jgi:hypothetical protein
MDFAGTIVWILTALVFIYIIRGYHRQKMGIKN